MHAWVPPVKGKQKLSYHSKRSKIKTVSQTLRSPSRPLIGRASRSEMKRRTKIMDVVCRTLSDYITSSYVNNNYSRIRGDGMSKLTTSFHFCPRSRFGWIQIFVFLFLSLCLFGTVLYWKMVPHAHTFDVPQTLNQNLAPFSIKFVPSFRPSRCLARFWYRFQ